MTTETIAVRLTAEQRAELEEIAKQRKSTISEIVRELVEKPKPPAEQLGELRAEAERIQERVRLIERTEEEKRIAEEERNRLESLSEIETQIRSTLPSLLALRYHALPSFINNAVGSLAELARQHDVLIEQIERGDIEAAALKEKYLEVGGDFEGLWSEMLKAVEQIEISEGARKLLEAIQKQRASWMARSDSVLRFLDVSLLADGGA